MFGQTEKKSARLLQLEKSWDDNKRLLRDTAQPKRHFQMTQDIKRFIVQSAEGAVSKSDKDEILRARRAATAGSFQKISNTFSFVHHEGTDEKNELKVVKLILLREGQLMSLIHLNNTAAGQPVDQVCLRILENLAQLRETTLNYLEAVCRWRQSIPNAVSGTPRPFIWEKKNYTIRLVTDLDFLASNYFIIQALNISPEQFRSNPLMLTNNLNDPSTWVDPAIRAAQDTGGINTGPIYESRLRLRYAERILLQEIEMYGQEQLPPGSESAGPQSIDYQQGRGSQQSYPPRFLGSLEGSISTTSAWGEPNLPNMGVKMAPSPLPPGQSVPSSGPLAVNADGSKNPYPYLTLPPGLEAAYIQEKFPELAPATSGRPESRTAASAGNTAGALARRQRSSGSQSAGGALPGVDMHRNRSSVSENDIFPPMEEEFPPPPTQSAEPVQKSNSFHERRPRAVSRSTLTKQGIEVTPFYTEVVTNIYKYPMLIALLTSTRHAPSTPKNRLTAPTSSSMLASRSRDIDDYSEDFGSLEQPSVYGSRAEPKTSFDRLVVKVYDVMGCAEYLINANIAEYVAFRGELDAKYNNNAFMHFRPEERDWWSANIRNLLRVQLKRNGQLHLTISKTLIDEVVLAAIHKAEEERLGRRVTRKSHRIQRPSTLHVSSRDNDLSVRRSKPNTTIVLEPHKLRNTYDSMKTVLAPTSLDDDYDYDFDP